MTHHINWKGLYYNSVENCTVINTDQEIVIKSIIKGEHDAIKFLVKYHITTNANWQVKSIKVDYILNDVHHQVYAIHNESNWQINGQPRPEFKNCMDVDITLTPFTNTLPINRLRLPLHQPAQIEVLYIDILENDIRLVRQQYTKKSSGAYNFQNVPNDFEADITVNENGFVAYYPELFAEQAQD